MSSSTPIDTRNESLVHFIEEYERQYWGEQLHHRRNEYLPHYIETHKGFCVKVNDLQKEVDFTIMEHMLQLRFALIQSKTLFTELIGERFRLERESNQLFNTTFPSTKLCEDSKHESFHNTQVIKMTRSMGSKHATQTDLTNMSKYLYTVKTKIQEMATSNHDIATTLLVC